MSEAVLDASALLTLLGSEPGGDVVAQALARGTAMSVVNLAEVVAKLAESGMPEEAIHATLDPLGLTLIDFDSNAAFQTGLLRPLTRSAGLSLGDRTCLALAQRLGEPFTWNNTHPHPLAQQAAGTTAENKTGQLARFGSLCEGAFTESVKWGRRVTR